MREQQGPLSTTSDSEVSSAPVVDGPTSEEQVASRVGQSAEMGAPVQRKALGDLGASIGGGASAAGAELGGEAAAATAPGAAALRGLKGGGAIPYKGEMEASFGADFSDVEYHSGPQATSAAKTMDAQAFTTGNKIVVSGSPSKALLAHELTHVVQQRGQTGPTLQPKAVGGGVRLDLAGESQAEAVEAAVASGGRALDVIGPLSASSAADQAIQRKYGINMTFSPEGFSRDHTYKLWGTAARIPIAGLPIYFLIDPKVDVYNRVGVGVQEGGSANIELGVRGTVGLGLSAGVPNVFEPYITGNPMVTGAGVLNLGQESQFELSAGVDFSLTGFIGARIGGVFNPRFQLGNVNIFKLTGVYVDNGGFDGSKLGFEWSDEVQEALDCMAELYRYVSEGVGEATAWMTDRAEDVADEYRYAWRNFNRLFTW